MTKKRLFSIFCLVAGVILLVTNFQAVQAATLTAYEIESLKFVREEEKLARDTYLTLYGVWEMDIFQTIANSEQNHMDAILGLLDKYNLEDPASSIIGEFQNEFLQAKYTELVTRGAQSRADALLVGCLIEEIDLVDLAERITEIKRQDILTVFQNLKDGSENHLRAYVASYESLTGETYTPVLLDQSTYQAIINASSDSGGNGFGGGGFSGGRNGGGNGGPGGGK
jgi:hypothetical protein